MPFASIDTTTSGDNTIVTAVPGRKIRLINYTAIATGAVAIRWKSGASTNLSGAMSLAANGGAAPSGSGQSPAGFIGLLETNSGDALVLNLGAAVQVSGHLTYQVI
jgi:type 1 fimbria pilin